MSPELLRPVPRHTSGPQQMRRCLSPPRSSAGPSLVPTPRPLLHSRAQTLGRARYDCSFRRRGQVASLCRILSKPDISEMRGAQWPLMVSHLRGGSRARAAVFCFCLGRRQDGPPLSRQGWGGGRGGTGDRSDSTGPTGSPHCGHCFLSPSPAPPTPASLASQGHPQGEG